MALTKQIPPEILEQLRAPFPAEAIQAIPGREYLSTVKAIYIVERLNKVFGMGGWTCENETFRADDTHVIVRGSILVFEYNLRTPVTFGGATLKAKGELADTYKSAVTDLISKSASFLEVAIDVFKGIQTHKNKKPTQTTKKQLKPLTEAQMKQLRAKLDNVNTLDELEMYAATLTEAQLKRPEVVEEFTIKRQQLQTQ